MEIHEVFGLYGKKTTDQALKELSDKSFKIWTEYVQRLENSITDPVKKNQFIQRTDNLYQNSLMAFVQKNLLKGQDFRRLLNKQEISKLISQLSNPGNSSPAQAKPIWDQLIQQTSLAMPSADAGRKTSSIDSLASEIQDQLNYPVTDLATIASMLASNNSQMWNSLSQQQQQNLTRSVAQELVRKRVIVQGLGQSTQPQRGNAPSAPAAAPAAPAAAQSYYQLVTPVQQALNQITRQGQLSAIGRIMRQGFTQNQNTINSTGEPSVDAMLALMGFNIK